jgi:hypothetical protein
MVSNQGSGRHGGDAQAVDVRGRVSTSERHWWYLAVDVRGHVTTATSVCH